MLVHAGPVVARLRSPHAVKGRHVKPKELEPFRNHVLSGDAIKPATRERDMAISAVY